MRPGHILPLHHGLALMLKDGETIATTQPDTLKAALCVLTAFCLSHHVRYQKLALGCSSVRSEQKSTLRSSCLPLTAGSPVEPPWTTFHCLDITTVLPPTPSSSDCSHVAQYILTGALCNEMISVMHLSEGMMLWLISV